MHICLSSDNKLELIVKQVTSVIDFVFFVTYNYLFFPLQHKNQIQNILA